MYEEERPKNARRGVACLYLGYDPVNNAYLVREWASKRLYYTADVTFHPMTFPCRGQPDRTLSDLNQYDNLAPHLTGPISQRFSVPANRDTPTVLEPDVLPTNSSSVRRSQRQHDYSHSEGVPIVDIPDGESFFIHNFGAYPEDMKEAVNMHDGLEWIKAELEENNMLKFHNIYEVVERSTCST